MAKKILQCGYMSGDTYSAAALLAADRTVKIILLVDTKARGQYADKSKLIEKIYAESGVSGQVSKLDISKEKADITAIWKTVSANSPTNRLPRPTPQNSHPDHLATLQTLYNAYAPKGSWPRSITAVTGLLAKAWQTERDETQKAVAAAWKIGKLPAEKKIALYEYMGSKFARNNFDIRDNIVVLWSRQSGKRGGRTSSWTRASTESASSRITSRRRANAPRCSWPATRRTGRWPPSPRSIPISSMSPRCGRHRCGSHNSES